MKNLLLGFLIGVITVMLIFNLIHWEKLLSTTVFKALFTLFLALLAGLIALFQVKANVISAARIKWIEEFKKNISEYISLTNAMIFYFKEFQSETDVEHKRNYHSKYRDAFQKAHSLKEQVSMNLNTNETIYKNISEIIEKIEILTGHANLSYIYELEKYPEVAIEFSNLTRLTQLAMKIEWNKAKNLINYVKKEN